MQTSATDSLQMGMATDTTSGAQGDFIITVKSFPYAIPKSTTTGSSSYFSLTLPPNSFTFTGSTYCKPTFAGNTIRNSATQVSFIITTSLPANSDFTITCNNVLASSFSMTRGVSFTDTSGLTTTMKVSPAEGNASTRVYQSFTPSSTLTPPPIGTDQLPAIQLTPEKKMLLMFTTPVQTIPTGNQFMVALDPVWRDSSAPSCTLHEMTSQTEVNIASQVGVASATAELTTYDGTTMNILTITFPTSLKTSQNYALWCTGIAIPHVALSTKAVGGILDPNLGQWRGKSDVISLPVLQDQIGSSIFSIQLAKWTAGQTTQMTTSILRSPVALTKGYSLTLTLPPMYFIKMDGATTCKIQQETTYKGGYTVVPSTVKITNDRELTFTIADQAEITNYWGVTQMVCDSVTATSSHPSINTISLKVFKPGESAANNNTPLYQRADGVLQDVYPAIIGSVKVSTQQSSSLTGADTTLDIFATPDNVSIQVGDYIAIIPDPDYQFIVGRTSCQLLLSNNYTTVTNSAGDFNIPIATEWVSSNSTASTGQANESTTTESGAAEAASLLNNSTVSWILKVTESSSSKQTILARPDSSITVKCTAVKNPRREKVQNSVLDFVIYNPTHGSISSAKGSFSAAILPKISPSPLGATQATFQPTSTATGAIVSMNIIVNSLSNPIPSAANSGSIQFTVPSAWGVNASGNTQCSCNRPNCVGTTTSSRNLDYVLTFRPNAQIDVTDVNGGNTIIFTCTNLKTPTSPMNQVNTLTIASYNGSDRIDATSSARMPAITGTGTDNATQGANVIHSLVFVRENLFSQAELSIFQSTYQQVFSSLGIGATSPTQQLHTGRSFQLPKTFRNNTSSDGGVIGMNKLGLTQRQILALNLDNEEGEQDSAQDDNHQVNTLVCPCVLRRRAAAAAAAAAAKSANTLSVSDGYNQDEDDHALERVSVRAANHVQIDLEEEQSHHHETLCGCMKNKKKPNTRTLNADDDATAANADDEVDSLDHDNATEMTTLCGCGKKVKKATTLCGCGKKTTTLCGCGKKKANTASTLQHDDDVETQDDELDQDNSTEMTTLCGCGKKRVKKATTLCGCGKAKKATTMHHDDNADTANDDDNEHNDYECGCLDPAAEATACACQDASADNATPVYTTLTTTTPHKFTTMDINDVYQFTQDSRVVIISTLLTSSQTGVTQENIMTSVDSTASRNNLSNQLLLNLSTRPYFKFSGISTDGTVLPAHCLNSQLDSDSLESDIDCGGPCDKCNLGLFCNEGDDCVSGHCSKQDGQERKTCSNSAFHLSLISALLVCLLALFC
jgi:hypothetical protein